MASESQANTYPHDYRAIFSPDCLPVIVGGQAVNLWCVTLLEPAEAQALSTKYGSKDIDVLIDPHGKIVDRLRSSPEWDYTPILREIRAGQAIGKSADGRALLVEVLNYVRGLTLEDTKASTTINVGGIEYRLLDPITMLKAKAANVREIPQDNPPRHDREHLQLLARCFPQYLRMFEQDARAHPELDAVASKVFNRAVAVLNDQKTAQTLRSQGIDPASLMPQELAHSPVAKIANVYRYQVPKLSPKSSQSQTI